MAADKTFYLTTAIFYVNGAPHLGHAYEAIASDALARFKRLDGYDVMFLSGTDEYGEKNARTAAKEGIEPQAFVDRNAALFEEMTDYLDISNDDFLRTSQPRHHAAAQAIWQKLADAGDIFRGSYEGWYSVRDEAYFTEDELTKGEGGGVLGAVRRRGRVGRRGQLVTSSGCRTGPTGCWRITRPTPTSSTRRAGATRW